MRGRQRFSKYTLFGPPALAFTEIDEKTFTSYAAFKAYASAKVAAYHLTETQSNLAFARAWAAQKRKNPKLQKQKVYIAIEQVVRATEKAVLIRINIASHPLYQEQFWIPRRKFKSIGRNDWVSLEFNGYFTLTSLTDHLLDASEISKAFRKTKPK